MRMDQLQRVPHICFDLLASLTGETSLVKLFFVYRVSLTRVDPTSSNVRERQALLGACRQPKLYKVLSK